MKTLFTHLKFPAIISFILVLPLMILELINRRNFHEGFPLPLFGILWLLPVIFILVLTPIVRDIKMRENIMINPTRLLLSVASLIFIAWLWFVIILDQMPCVLGVPNCD